MHGALPSAVVGWSLLTQDPALRTAHSTSSAVMSAGVEETEHGLFVRTHVAPLVGGRLPIPSSASPLLLEVGASDRNSPTSHTVAPDRLCSATTSLRLLSVCLG